MLQWVGQSLRDRIKSNPDEVVAELNAPQTADEFFALAVAYDQLGKRKYTESLLRTALQKNLCHFPSLYSMALKSFEKSLERTGKNYFRRAIRLDPDASKNTLSFQKELKFSLSSYEDAGRFGVWCLKELEAFKKASAETEFQLGRTLFEQSRLKEAIPYLRDVLSNKEMASEATEYLSYIYEHLYRGDELILKTLELAQETPERSDLFFNLAMVCQHDQKRLDLSMHFFYLATREDPQDPGLRFSLEQAALELISQLNRAKGDHETFLLMLAHLYQGSLGVAKRYASELSAVKYPESFQTADPFGLWNNWLLKDEGPLGMSLKHWFGVDKDKKTVRYISSKQI
ncbi:MAG: hypothetical protein J0L93_07500 [Deltaproteobacteria bacterium]|nr:hypothetical protein [Deltaproteobacteria bacterium]